MNVHVYYVYFTAYIQALIRHNCLSTCENRLSLSGPRTSRSAEVADPSEVWVGGGCP